MSLLSSPGDLLTNIVRLSRLIIAGIIGVALFFAVMALASIIFRQYFLTVNIFNFDPSKEWKSLSWYSDNANISNGEWKAQLIPEFTPACKSALHLHLLLPEQRNNSVRPASGVSPPGFSPVVNFENVVTYLSMAFENDSTFLQGLGIGILMSRDDDTEGMY